MFSSTHKKKAATIRPLEEKDFSSYTFRRGDDSRVGHSLMTRMGLENVAN